MRICTSARLAAVLLIALVATSCTDHSAKVLGPRPPQGNGLFQTYVSIGNSITAGMQSGGINDSTQRQSFAYLLALQMGTRFAYPSFTKPGCPPPIGNWVTQKLIDSLAPVPNE